MPKHGQRVLEFVEAYQKLFGQSPSYETIAGSLGLSSKSNMHRIVHELRSRGYLTVKPHAMYSIKLVDKTMEKVYAAIV